MTLLRYNKRSLSEMRYIIMDITPYLIEQCLAHPSSQPQDMVKQCYQAAFGAEHLLADLDRAKTYLEQEFASVEPSTLEKPLCEVISDNICRMDLAAWKAHDLPMEWLFSMFSASATVWAEANTTENETATPKKRFLHYLDTADQLIRQGSLPVSFDQDTWTAFLNKYESSGMTAVHHSEAYRLAEKPAYRIVQSKFMRLLPILEKIAESYRTHLPSITASAPICVIAIDGRAASGKSTMADQLAQILNADIIHMDDFFLPLELRTAERLHTPGGNVHYERFCQEVLPHLHSGHPFSYRRFDCEIMAYNGVRQIGKSLIRIVEGSYSLHPTFGNYADITVFSDVEPEKQMRRILHRNGPSMAEMFRNRWIPMEEQYFDAYKVSQNVSLCISS